MTPLQLIDSMARELKALLSDPREWEGEALCVCSIKRPSVENRVSYACIIPEEGMDRMEDSDMAVQRIMVEVYVPQEAAGAEGWRDVLGAIQRIRERFKHNALLDNRYEVLDPITWALDDNEEESGFRGSIHLLVELPQIHGPGADI